MKYFWWTFLVFYDIHVKARPTIEFDGQNYTGDAEVVMEMAKNYTLVCYAEFSVEWILPDFSIYKRYTLDGRSVMQSITEPVSQNGRYKLILIIHQVQVYDTCGFYICRKADGPYGISSGSYKVQRIEDTPLQPAPEESRVFINLITKFSGNIFALHRTAVQVVDNRKASYIDCRGAKKIAMSLSINETWPTNFTYDYKFGFEVPAGSLSLYAPSLTLECAPKELYSINTVDLKIIPLLFQVSTRSVNGIELENVASVQKNFSLLCQANSFPIECTWLLPLNVPKDRYTVVSNSTSSILTVSSGEASDSGNYTCNCTDEVNRSNSSMVSIRVHTSAYELNIWNISNTTVTIYPTSPDGTLCQKPADFEFSFSYLSRLHVQDFEGIYLVRKYSTFEINGSSDLNIIFRHVMRDVFYIGDLVYHGLYRTTFNQTTSVSNTRLIHRTIKFNFLDNATCQDMAGRFEFGIWSFQDWKNSTRNINYDVSLKYRHPRTRVFVNASPSGLSKESLDTRFLEQGQLYTIWCIAPLTDDPSWPELNFYEGCLAYEKCAKQRSLTGGVDPNFVKHQLYKTTFESVRGLTTRANKTGSYECSCDYWSSNGHRHVTSTLIHYIVNDIARGIEIDWSPKSLLYSKYHNSKQQLYMPLNSKLTLKCKVQRHRPRLRITWYFQADGSSIKKNVRKLPDLFNHIRLYGGIGETSICLEFTIHKTAAVHAGMYICVSDPIGNKEPGYRETYLSHPGGQERITANVTILVGVESIF